MNSLTKKWMKRSLIAASVMASSSVFAYQNGTMMQYFHWYITPGDNLWSEVANEASDLASKGVTALWLPPAYKGMSEWDVGYSAYDLYDLGEFAQKGTVRTKYGTKDEYLNAINKAHAAGMQIYADIVFNQKLGADSIEGAWAVHVDANNRNQEYGSDIYIDSWTGFDFPGRNNKYSDFKWHWYHFDGVDWDQNSKENCGGKCVYKFRGAGKAWDTGVSSENGNYDYLMGADLDMDHPEVINELKNWGMWYTDFAGLDGYRLDAVKHIKPGFISDWIDTMRGHSGKEMFSVAEYWTYDLGTLENYLNKTGYKVSLFDAPLHQNFHNASKAGGFYDMGSIMNGTLMKTHPANAVTLVENHDTQPLQDLESPVEDWFKPLAYSLILLRQEGYPNIFYPDYYGATYTDKGNDGKDYTITLNSHKAILDVLLGARRDYAYGIQHSYLDNKDVIGWTREGDSEHHKGLAVLMTDSNYEGKKWMFAGNAHSHTCFVDITGHYAASDKVCSNNDGWAEFKTKPGSVSVWVKE